MLLGFLLRPGGVPHTRGWGESWGRKSFEQISVYGISRIPSPLLLGCHSGGVRVLTFFYPLASNIVRPIIVHAILDFALILWYNIIMQTKNGFGCMPS